jgi:ABC-2 type transport system ATP-binding protein
MEIIEIKNLCLEYEARIVDPSRHFLKNILWAKYKKQSVLKQLNFSIRSSGITGILGKNGAGKTTLMKILTGLLTPTSGYASVLGFSAAKREKNFLTQIGAIFGQKKMLWPELSLLENMRLTRAIYKISEKDFQEESARLISLFKFGPLVQRQVKTLSLGESMKAEIINILLFKPKLLFLDEPTIGLDISSQLDLRAAIKMYARENDCHILLTSHNLKDIAELADQVYFLSDGRIEKIAEHDHRPEYFENQLTHKMMAEG